MRRAYRCLTVAACCFCRERIRARSAPDIRAQIRRRHGRGGRGLAGAARACGRGAARQGDRAARHRQGRDRGRYRRGQRVHDVAPRRAGRPHGQGLRQRHPARDARNAAQQHAAAQAQERRDRSGHVRRSQAAGRTPSTSSSSWMSITSSPSRRRCCAGFANR